MSRLPPLNALRAFEAAARHLSFRKAAEEIGVTPTAISHQIRQLEDACGRPLFRRQPRPLALTEAGQHLYPVLTEGFRAFSKVFDEISEQLQARPLRVTTTSAFAVYWLVPRLPDWRRHAPGIPLEIIGTDSVVDMTADGADIAIRYACEAPRGEGVRWLFEDRYGPVCRPELLPLGAPVAKVHDLIPLPRIHYSWQRNDRRDPTWEVWWRAADEANPGLPEATPVWLSFLEETHAIEAVLRGEGIGMLSDVIVSRELAEGRLIRAHPMSVPGLGYWLVTRSAHPVRKGIDVFCNWIAEQAGKVGERSLASTLT